MQIRRRLIYLSLLLCFANQALAQKRAYNWVFGTKAGIAFSPDGSVTSTRSKLTGLIGSTPAGYEGVSSISDEDGNLLMYSAGKAILDKNGDIMPGGNGLNGGGSFSQSVIIVPNPGNSDQYYVITSGGTVQYTVVDMSLKGNGTAANPLGAVVSGKKNISLGSTSQENLGVVEDASGNGGYWIVYRKNGTGQGFKAYHVDGSTGLVTGPISSGSNGSITAGGISSIKFNACSNKLIHLSEQDKSIELWNFNNATGKVEGTPVKLFTNSKVYSAEFSPKGDYVYVCDLSPGRVFRFRTDDINPTIEVVSSLTAAGGTLQLGPFGRIFVSTFQKDKLGAILDPDNVNVSNVDFRPNFVSLKSGTKTGHGLPPFVASFVNNVVTISHGDLCALDVDFDYTYTGTEGTSAGDVTWDMGDGTIISNPSTVKNFSHNYDSYDTYTVTLTIKDEYCGVKTMEQEITLIDPNGSADFTYSNLDDFCNTNFALTPGTANGNITWDFDGLGTSNGKTPSFQFPAAGDYNVSVSVFDPVCGNTFPASKTITVGPSELTQKLKYCAGKENTLTLSDNVNYCWSTTDANDCDLGTGTSVKHTFTGTGTQNVFVNVNATLPDQTTGRTNANLGQFNSNPNEQRNEFTTSVPLRIRSVQVKHSQFGGCNGKSSTNMTVTLFSGGVSTGQSYTAPNIGCNVLETLPVDFVINTPGTYQLRASTTQGDVSTMQTFNQAGSKRPIAGVINVKDITTSYSGPFVNWEIGDVADPWCGPKKIIVEQESPDNCCPEMGEFSIANGTSKLCPGTNGNGSVTSSFDALSSGTAVGDYSLKWEFQPDGQTTWSAASGTSSTTNTLSAKDVMSNGAGKYRLSGELTAEAGCKIYSNEVTIALAVNPSASIQTSSLSLCASATDGEITFKAEDGTGPWKITYTEGSTEKTVDQGAGDASVKIPASAEKTYAITKVENNEGCVATISGQSITVGKNPEVELEVKTYCSDEIPAGITAPNNSGDYIVVAEYKKGDKASINVTDGNGTAFTKQGDFWVFGLVSENDDVELKAEDKNKCNVFETTASKTCSCPASGTMTLADAKICEEGKTNVKVDFTGGSGAYDIILKRNGSEVTRETKSNSDTDHTFGDLSDIGEYSVTIISKGDADCEATATGTATLSNFAKPDVSLTGVTTEICNDGVAEAEFTVALGAGDVGTGWEFDYKIDNGTATTINATVSPFSLKSKSKGTFTLSSVKDGNGCVNDAPTASSVEVKYFDDVVVEQSYICQRDDATLSSNEVYVIELTVTQGDLASIIANTTATITSGTDAGNTVIFTQVGSTNVFRSNEINEDSKTTVNVKDKNACNPIELKDLQTKCSCPSAGSIAFDGGISSPLDVCAGASQDIVVTYGGDNSSDHIITLVLPDGSEEVKNPLAGETSATFSVTQKGKYTARIKNVVQDCETNASGSVEIRFFDTPSATIGTSTSPLCASAAISLDVSLSAGTITQAPYEVDLYKAGVFEKTIQLASLSTVEVLAAGGDNSGEYKLQDPRMKSCPDVKGTATGSVDVNLKKPTASPVIISGPQEICPSTQTYTLSADATGLATSYVWSYPGNLADEQTGLTHSISLNSVQTAALTAFYRNQCGDGPSSNAYSVEVKAQPSVSINAVPSICQGESVSLSATAEC